MSDAQKGRLWADDEIGVLHKLAQTHTAKQIAEILGRPAKGVYSKAQKYGIQLRKTGAHSPHSKYSDTEVARCMELRKRGLYASEIAKETGIPLGTLNNWLSGFQRVQHLPGND